MKILVTIKRVTDPNVKVRLLADKSGVDTANAEYKINPYDEYALEEAMRLRDKHGDRIKEVVVVSVGDEAATKELRVAMAMGADRGILVQCDDKNLDSSVIATILAAVVKAENPDLVLMGKLSVDGESIQVPAMLAQLLGWPQGGFALEIALEGDAVKLGCQADGGLNRFEVSLPCIVTRTDMPDEWVRYASLPGIMKAKKKPLDVKTLADLGVTAATPRTRILGYDLPPKRAAGRIVESVDQLVDKLKNEAKVL
jgi:electron transfer flavoprotein beta subunit